MGSLKELKLWLRDFGKAYANFWKTQRLKAIVLLALILPAYIGLNWSVDLALDGMMMIVSPLFYGIFLIAIFLISVALGLKLMNELVKRQRAIVDDRDDNER